MNVASSLSSTSVCVCRGDASCSAHFCHLNHFCHSPPVLSIHINSFCQPHHFCQLLSTHCSSVLSTISTTYVATDEVTTFVNKARPLLSTVMRDFTTSAVCISWPQEGRSYRAWKPLPVEINQATRHKYSRLQMITPN